MASGQLWTVDSLGGYLASPSLSKQMLTATLPLHVFRQFTTPLTDLNGGGKGDTVYFDKYGRVQTRGRVLSETEEVPETQFTLSRDSLTINEYGNSIPYSQRLEFLQTLSINSPIMENLKEDYLAVTDAACAQKFMNTDIIYTPTGSVNNMGYTIVTTGTAVATSTRPPATYDIKNIVDYFRAAKVPQFDNRGYICICSQAFMRSISDDPRYEKLVLRNRPEDLYNYEVGHYEGVTFIIDTEVLSNSMTGGGGEAIFFGKDPVFEAEAKPVTIAADTPKDFGRSKKMGWLMWCGWKEVWDYSTDAQFRIIKYSEA